MPRFRQRDKSILHIGFACPASHFNVILGSNVVVLDENPQKPSVPALICLKELLRTEAIKDEIVVSVAVVLLGETRQN